MRERSRPIPVIVFTAHAAEVAEAQMGVSERSKRAAFVGLLSKPFDLAPLVEIVARVVEDSAGGSRFLPQSPTELLPCAQVRPD